MDSTDNEIGDENEGIQDDEIVMIAETTEVNKTINFLQRKFLYPFVRRESH